MTKGFDLFTGTTEDFKLEIQVFCIKSIIPSVQLPRRFSWETFFFKQRPLQSYFLCYFSAVADTSFYPKNPLVVESNYPFFHTNLQGESITWKRKLAIGVFKSGKLDIDEIITWKPGN